MHVSGLEGGARVKLIWESEIEVEISIDPSPEVERRAIFSKSQIH